MAKPTLTAQLALANARIALLESKLETARACYVQHCTTIASLEGQLANKAEAKPKAAWQPSEQLRAAKELAMATGKVTKVA